MDDLDESRSLQLKGLLSEYFDKRRDLSHILAQQEVEELSKYKVEGTRWLLKSSAVIWSRKVRVFQFPMFFLCFAVVGLGGSDQSGHQEFSGHPK